MEKSVATYKECITTTQAGLYFLVNVPLIESVTTTYIHRGGGMGSMAFSAVGQLLYDAYKTTAAVPFAQWKKHKESVKTK